MGEKSPHLTYDHKTMFRRIREQRAQLLHLFHEAARDGRMYIDEFIGIYRKYCRDNHIETGVSDEWLAKLLLFMCGADLTLDYKEFESGIMIYTCDTKEAAQDLIEKTKPHRMRKMFLIWYTTLHEMEELFEQDHVRPDDCIEPKKVSLSFPRTMRQFLVEIPARTVAQGMSSNFTCKGEPVASNNQDNSHVSIEKPDRIAVGDEIIGTIAYVDDASSSHVWNVTITIQ